ncbi:MAG: hypothetical protein K8I27_05250 [Planctomycetes bacterium]|nr:hypothetical protein [Planctomycetota bacterium]
MDVELLADLETPEEAERAFELLQSLADAVHRSPGGKGLTERVLNHLTVEELRTIAKRDGVEIGVIKYEIGRLLRGEQDADGLRVMARKMVTLTGEWQGDIAKLSRASDDDLGELLKTIGKECAIAKSASVRDPGPPTDFETLRKSDGY